MEECHRDLTGNIGGVSCVLQLEDGRLMSGSYQTVKVWDVVSGLCLATLLSGHRSAVDSLTVLHGPLRIISADDQGTVRIWDAVTYSCLSEHTIISLWNMHGLDAHSISLRNRIFLRTVLADGRTPDPSWQKYISSPIIEFPQQIIQVQPLSGADDSGLVLIQEGGSVFSVCSFTTVQSQRWIRRRGWLLLVHSYRAAARR
jgi:WD40 repeat protein